MAFTAEDVITRARDQHPAFTPELTPDRVLLRHLSAYQRELVGRIASRAPELVATTVDVAMPLADFDAGAALGVEVLELRGADAVATGDSSKIPVFLVPWAARYDPVVWPAAYLEGNTLHLLGTASNWTDVASVSVSLVALPAALTSEANSLVLPDAALPACAASCAAFLAQRCGADLPVPQQRFDLELTVAEGRLLEMLMRRPATTAFTTEIW